MCLMEDLNIVDERAFYYINVFLKNNYLSFPINISPVLILTFSQFITSILFIIHCSNKNAHSH